jgi:hypothetical protein
MYQSNLLVKSDNYTILKFKDKIDLGKLRVPEFQRDFVWGPKNVVELFASIYEGFPIGSMLLWTTSNSKYRPKLDRGTPFPIQRVSYPTTFVLDGVQRLSSLYGAFSGTLTRFPQRPILVFDLAEKEPEKKFQLTRDANINPNFFPLSALFSDDFVSEQERLYQREGGRELVRVLLDLSYRFREYEIPVWEIADRDIREVVNIFLRLNRNVKRLSKSEFDAAQEWLTEHSSP